MTAKELLAKVKAVFAEPVAPAMPAEPGEPIDQPTGVDCPLQDGRMMHCDPDLSVGAKATIDGQPAPAGDYVHADGSTCTVDESGVITNVAQAAPVTTDTPAEPTFEERLKAIEEALKKMQPQCQTQYATEQQLKEAEEKIKKQDKVIEGLFELAEKLAETPTAEPVTLNGNKKEQFERKEKKEKRIEAIAEAITQMKQKK